MNYGTLSLALAMTASLGAQDVGYLLGFSDGIGPSGPQTQSYAITRFLDLDGDGTINDLTEHFPFLKKTFNQFIRSGSNSPTSFISDIEKIQEGDGFAYYVTDSADGRVQRCFDANNNGCIDANETTEFYDFQIACSARAFGCSPDSVAIGRDAQGRTVVYCAVDDLGNNPGIYRLVDLDGNGDAKGNGEATVFVDASKNLTVPGKSGPVALSSDFYTKLHVLPDGTLIAWSAGPSSNSFPQNPDQFCWFAFTDNNGTASASVFFNPSRNNGIATHPSFDAGNAFSFPQLDATFTDPGRHPVWCDFSFFTDARLLQPGVPTYYITSGYNTGWAHINPNGVAVDGLVFKWSDLNGDSRPDNGEFSLFANHSGASVAGVPAFTYNGVSRMDQRIFGFDSSDGRLHFMWDSRNGSKGQILTLDDAATGNNNGVVETGEARQTYQFTGAGNNVYHPFFGPFLMNMTTWERGELPGPFPAGLAPYGQGCPNPSTGFSGVMSAAGGEPKVGNGSFETQVIRVLQGSQNFFAIGIAAANNPLPTAISFPGCAQLNDFLLGAFGPAVADADGVASLPLPVPNTPALAGAIMRVQALTATGSGRVTASNGLEVTIQP